MTSFLGQEIHLTAFGRDRYTGERPVKRVLLLLKREIMVETVEIEVEKSKIYFGDRTKGLMIRKVRERNTLMMAAMFLALSHLLLALQRRLREELVVWKECLMTNKINCGKCSNEYLLYFIHVYSIHPIFIEQLVCARHWG